MKLTRDEIAVLLNYYSGLEFDLEDRIEALQQNCMGRIDTDLYEIQRTRYELKYKKYESRINELHFQDYDDEL